jgi:hypothetical protein
MIRSTSIASGPQVAAIDGAGRAARFPMIAAVWRELAAGFFDPYRPERHYMRGPGPRWRERPGARLAATARPVGSEAGDRRAGSLLNLNRSHCLILINAESPRSSHAAALHARAGSHVARTARCPGSERSIAGRHPRTRMRNRPRGDSNRDCRVRADSLCGSDQEGGTSALAVSRQGKERR